MFMFSSMINKGEQFNDQKKFKSNPPIGCLPYAIGMRTPPNQSGVINFMSNYNLYCPSRRSLCYLFAIVKLLAHLVLIETLICQFIAN